MAKLSSAERNGLPATAFAIPEKRSYPIHDVNHARAALSMVAKYGSATERARVRTAVHKRYPNIGASEEPMATPSGIKPRQPAKP